MQNKGQTARRVYGICLTVLTVAVAALFIIQIWLLFRATDKSPYTVETVSYRFSQIAIPFYLWLGAIVGGGVLSYAFPEAEETPKAWVDPRITLQRLKGRLPQNEGGMVEVKRENIVRKAMWGVCAALSVIATVVAVLFLVDSEYAATFNTEFFKTHTEAEKLIKLFPIAFVLLCVCAGALIYQSYSLKKELSAVKKAIAESAKRGEKTVKTEEKPIFCEKIKEKFAFLSNEKTVLVLRVAVAVIGLGLFVGGICFEGTAEVLTKAINICTQCIGLG